MSCQSIGCFVSTGEYEHGASRGLEGSYGNLLIILQVSLHLQQAAILQNMHVLQ